jgi:hypothetical protein
MATFLIGGISLTPELVNLFFGDSTCIGDRGEPDARELRSRRAPPLLLRSFKSEKKRQTEKPCRERKESVAQGPRNRMPV